MNQEISRITSSLDKATISPEQFDQVVEAILGGKYSWACVLMLRFAGYNPLHYIPYRTYNRLLKENSQVSESSKPQNEIIKIPPKQSVENRSDSNVSASCLSKIKDLAYLEVVGKQKTEICGGNLEQWLATQICEYQSVKSELKPERTQDFFFNSVNLISKSIELVNSNQLLIGLLIIACHANFQFTAWQVFY